MSCISSCSIDGPHDGEGDGKELRSISQACCYGSQERIWRGRGVRRR